MGKCNIDHSIESVQEKLEDQKSFMPQKLAANLKGMLDSRRQSQETLNDIFHLLKKYDLASEKEREERDKKLEAHIVQYLTAIDSCQTRY